MGFRLRLPVFAGHYFPSSVLCVVVFVSSDCIFPSTSFTIPSSSVLGFDLCQRMKYFCHLKEPAVGIFPGKRKTLTNYSFEQFEPGDLPFAPFQYSRVRSER